MKIACISQVRDECDIIELFARINCRVFDHMYIIDNNSADATPFILEKLKAEGLPISTTFEADNTYNQDGLTTQALYAVNSYGIYDWFFFLDADEFIVEPKDDVAEKLITMPQTLLPKAMWRSWVPTNTNYFEHKAPLNTIFAPLEKENHITYKAIVDKRRAPLVTINHGNHGWFKKGTYDVIPDWDSKIRIDHFPVRSPEQMTSKAILSHYRQLVRSAAKAKDPKALGRTRTFFQLATIHNELRESNYVITKEDLRRWGVWYNTEVPPTGNDPQIDSAIESEHFGFEEDIIQFPELARIALGARFDKQMDIMQGVILKMHKKLMEFGVMS